MKTSFPTVLLMLLLLLLLLLLLFLFLLLLLLLQFFPFKLAVIYNSHHTTQTNDENAVIKSSCMFCAHLHFSAASDKNYKQILSKVCPTHLLLTDLQESGATARRKSLTFFKVPLSSWVYHHSSQNVIL